MDRLREHIIRGEAAQSLRFLVRTGELARSDRRHEDDLSDRREPDELFEPIIPGQDRVAAQHRP